MVNNTTYGSVKLCLKISLPLSLSIRGHPCSNQQVILPIKSEKFIGSELTYVSTHAVNFQSWWTARSIADQTKLLLDLTCITNEMFWSAIILNPLVNRHRLTWFIFPTTNTALQEIEPGLVTKTFSLARSLHGFHLTYRVRTGSLIFRAFSYHRFVRV